MDFKNKVFAYNTGTSHLIFATQKLINASIESEQINLVSDQEDQQLIVDTLNAY